MKSFLLYCFFVLGGVYVIQSQNKQFRAYTIEDGLPQSQIYAMAQDHKGYLWLGTQGGGLARFDGSDFSVWNETKGLGSNYIHALKAINDTLLIGTRQGLSIKIKKSFLNIDLPQVNKIIQFHKKTYVLTNEGVYKIKNDLSVEKVTLHNEIDHTQTKDALYLDEHFWIATQNGLWKLKTLESNPTLIEKLQVSDFTSLVGFNNKIYASTFNDGTLVFDPKNFNDAVLIQEPLRINSISIQNNNELWVATDNVGISIINTKTHKILYTLNSANGLSVPHVRQVLTDQQSNLWIATSGGGLYKYFQNDFKHYNTETGLNGNRIYAVHKAKDGIWISNSEAGLMRIDPMGIHDIEMPETFSDAKIKAITSDDNGNIWAGSDGNGLLFKGKITKDSIVVDSLKKSKTRYPIVIEKEKVLSTETGFPFDWIRAICAKNDTVWAATYASGIVKFGYYPNHDSLAVFNTFSKFDDIEDLYIKDMIADNNKLWYTTQNGHIGYLADNKVTHIGEVLNQKIAINSIVIHNNILFIGTAGQGIWWSNEQSLGAFKKLKGNKQITSDNIYQLIFDQQGYLWVGTEQGVDKIELDQDTNISDVFHFGKNDGFLGIETCLNAVDLDNKGHLWFGTIYGLTEYQPSTISKESQKPNLFIEEISVNNKSIDTIDFSSWINTDKVLKFNPNQRQVSFTYKTVDLDHPKGVEYRYKLNDNDWSSWTTNRIQDLPELNFGAHSFIVQSRNYRWKQSDPKRFLFYIENPLYTKGWFLSVIVVIAIIVLIIAIRSNIKRIQRKNTKAQKQLQLENHLLTLEQKALRLQMNPHFIFNVLNGIKAMAPTKPEKMNDTVNSFASLLRETLTNSRKDTISLDQEIKTLTHYIEVEQLMAEKQFDYHIELKTDIDVDEILIPPMLVQPFVENAIRHGILKGPRSGVLEITFETINETLKVTITDNGIGIFNSRDQKPKTDHQSMALKVTKERLISISGENTLEIKEVKQKDGSTIGTTITFKIPLQTDY
ncbi:two-component regulator propeller domain-containing protein [uncultured Psychroserpens sp.]|uniref:ligand-binding sensor domain-containing protein n=1 Tax=uncultured Psychroserpens sp. TaxID=255436 RepID=UPI00260B99AA|nr:two-component regulator propeller domain-containing protein [uncultured Psychroserpens sp.]